MIILKKSISTALFCAVSFACSHGAASHREKKPSGHQDAEPSSSQSPNVEPSSSDIDATSSDPTPDVSPPPPAAACNPVRHYQHKLSVNVPLACGAGAPATVFNFAVPDTGRAIGRFLGTINNSGQATEHFWNAYVTVGKPDYVVGIGDDVCPGYLPVTKTNVGAGTLSSEAPRVMVQAYSGSEICTPGTLSIAAGSVLDVWVEDDAETCRGKDIQLKSYYQSTKFSTTQVFQWSTSMTELMAFTFPNDSAGATARILTVVEGTPLALNQRCGGETASLVTSTSHDGKVLQTFKNLVPASLGMGHLVLFTDNEVDLNVGTNTFTMLVGANTSSPVTTGGCCGDGVMAVIRER